MEGPDLSPCYYLTLQTLQNQLLEQNSMELGSGNQPLLTAASLASALGMQLNMLNSSPVTTTNSSSQTGFDSSSSAAQTLAVSQDGLGRRCQRGFVGRVGGSKGGGGRVKGRRGVGQREEGGGSKGGEGVGQREERGWGKESRGGWGKGRRGWVKGRRGGGSKGGEGVGQRE